MVASRKHMRFVLQLSVTMGLTQSRDIYLYKIFIAGSLAHRWVKLFFRHYIFFKCAPTIMAVN